MRVETMFPRERMTSDEAMVFIARKLSEKVTDLEDMLDDEARYSKYLDDLLMTIGAGADIGMSSYNGKKYISLGFIGEDHPKYKELVNYFKLREEEKECEDTN